ncbi:MAG: major facilitator transporter [Ilumatobacteraceae bacterium]|nr:major facilitator transporter [Ilumatobacteraceae bacterium]
MTASAAAPAGELVRFGTATGKWLLIGTILGSGMASLDATVVNVALPRLSSDLHADFADLQWVINGYTLTLASLILVGGSLGDRYGRRKVFSIGVIAFAGASLLCGLAPNVATLVGARMLQGVGGAMLAPGSLAILQASFHPDDRARAIGAWSGFGGITTAIGPFVGGWLVDAASWRYVFLLNLPLAALVLWVAAKHIPETRSPPTEGGADIIGAIVGALGLAGLTYGLIEQSWPLGLAGLIGLVAFVLVERATRSPMLPLTIFRSVQFSATNVVTLFVYAGLAAALFLIGLVLQEALGYSPIEAGAASLPITVVMLVFSARAGALAQRIGPRLPMTLGPFVIAAGLLLMTRIRPGVSYFGAVFPAVLVFAGGLALTVAPLTATVLAAANAEHSGIASGVNNAVARVGGLLAVAAVPLIAGFAPSAVVGPDKLVAGFHAALVGAAVLVAIGGVVAWTTIRSTVLQQPLPGEEPSAQPSAADAGEPYFHCGVGGPPLVVGTSPSSPTSPTASG